MKTIRRPKSQKRILMSYALLVLAAVTLLIVLFNAYTYGVISQKSTDMINYQVSHYADIMDNDLDDLMEICYNMISDLDFINEVRNTYKSSDSPEYSAIAMTNMLEDCMNMNDNIFSAIFINSKDYSYAHKNKFFSGYLLEELQDKSQREAAVKTITENDGFTFLNSHHRSNDSNYLRLCFYIGCPLIKYTQNINYGVLMLGIKSSFFDAISNSPNHSMDLNSLMVDESGSIIYCSDDEWIGRELDDYLLKRSISSRDYYLTSYSLRHANWKLFSFMSKDIVFSELVMARYFQYALILIISVVFLLSVYSVINRQRRRIAEIADGILDYSRRIQPETQMPLSDFTELNGIITQFNQMIKRIDSLIDCLKHEREVREDALNRHRKAELKVLEMQINPHFLYNTLDMINWMALEKNEYEISNMLGNMSSLLRYSVSNIDRPVLVMAEIEWLKKYLFLQEKRFLGLFTHRIHIEDSLDSCVLYRMLLQPLVENCIIHAFAERNGGGVIDISIYKGDNDKLIIDISDNGTGMTPEKLAELRSLDPSDDYSTENLGVRNVINRLNAYYDEAGRLEIESGPGGTKMRIILPIIIHAKNDESANDSHLLPDVLNSLRGNDGI